MLLALILALGAQNSKMIHEPDWSHSLLSVGKPEFVAIRKAVQEKYGPLPEAALSPDDSEANAAMASYERTHSAKDAFRAVYLQLTTRKGVLNRQFRIGVDPFKDMPRDDYEVARLHFLWSWIYIEYKLKPLGERLLAKDPNDAEVLWADSCLCSHQRDEQKGLDRAEKAMQLVPCARTYLRYADARGMMRLVRPKSKSEDYKVARQYYEKFLAVAGKNDPDRGGAVTAVNWLKSHGY